MPHGIECQCCREIDTVHERLVEQEEINCITSHNQFSVVCLNKNILYTALVMMNSKRCEPIVAAIVKQVCMMLIRVNKNLIHKCIIVFRAYRLAAYRQFIHWTYSRLGRGKGTLLVLYLLYVMSFRKLMVSILVVSWLSCSLHLHYLYHKNLFP